MIYSKLLLRSLFFCSLLLITTGAVSCPSTLIFDDKTEICVTDLDRSILDLPCKYCPKDSTFRSAISRSGSNGVSFAISEDKENPSWGISGARWTTPANADQQAIERCKSLENKISPNKNKSSCKLLITAVAPVGKVTSSFSRKDFFEKLNIFSASVGGNLSGDNLAKKDRPIAEGAEITTNENPKIIAANDQPAAAPKKNRSDIDRERQQLAEDRLRLEAEKRQREAESKKDNTDIELERQQLAEDRLRLEAEKRQRETESRKDNTDIELERQQLAEERRRLEAEKRQREAESKKDNNQTENLNVSTDNRKRFALVIGNSNYNSLPKLPNAVNDARVITQSLRLAGFQVFTHENLDLTSMQNVVRVFGEKLGKNDVGLFYYAGHGVQVKGKNFIIPIKENIKKSFEVPSSAIDVDLVLATLENIKNDLNIVVLDACRSSFPGESRGTNRGLATIEAAKGTFIAFATAPGKEALDGSDSNSPYTKHLAKLIGKKGVPLEQVFKEVRKAVVAETNGEQVPWENSSLMGDFYFQK